MSSHVADIGPNDFAVGIEGPESEPGDIRTAEVLELAASMLALVVGAAERSGVDLRFRGLRIENKCTAMVARASNIEDAQHFGRDALRLLAGQGEDRGLSSKVARARRALGALEPGQSGFVMAGPWRDALRANKPAAARMPTSIEIHRAKPYASGGKGEDQYVRFMCGYEPDFTLSATLEHVRRIGPHMKDEVEIEMEVVRLTDGTVEEGRLLEFHPLEQRDALTALRDWYRESVGTAWDDVDDIEEALAR